MGENETQVETSQPAPGLLEALKELLRTHDPATYYPERMLLARDAARAAIAEEEEKRTFTAVFHWATGRMPTAAEVQRGVIDSETKVAEPDHAARLREAAPRMWKIIEALALGKCTTDTIAGPVILPMSPLMGQADALYDELQPTEDEASA